MHKQKCLLTSMLFTVLLYACLNLHPFLMFDPKRTMAYWKPPLRIRSVTSMAFWDIFLVLPFNFYRRKLQSLEKDRQDLQSTIKALQEGMHTEICSYK